MIYSHKRPVGFPNGRLLTDDVAELLATYGDTLLKEISYIAGGWPRANDQRHALPAPQRERMRRAGSGQSKLCDQTIPENLEFPYLAQPWKERPQPPPPSLSSANQMKVWLTGLGVLASWSSRTGSLRGGTTGDSFGSGICRHRRMRFDPRYSGPEVVTGVRPRILRLHVHGGAERDICQHVLPDVGSEGDPPLPVYEVTLRRVVAGLFRHWRLLQAAIAPCSRPRICGGARRPGVSPPAASERRVSDR